MKKLKKIIASLVIIIAFIVSIWSIFENNFVEDSSVQYENIDEISEYSENIYVELNNNIPLFEESQYVTEGFEEYSDLDDLDRCGVAFACIGQEIMPTEERGSIGHIKPTGWHTVKYDCIPERYLYNRCHLIGFQLAGENANEKNLITGTRYFNVDGMLPFENLVADYVDQTNNHVLYRVTPIYEQDDLVAKGVVMEAYSVEDQGQGISFHVFVYNIQPGVVINYANGESYEVEQEIDGVVESYILNINTYKFHDPDCSCVEDINPENQESFSGTKSELIKQGYSPCGVCNP